MSGGWTAAGGRVDVHDEAAVRTATVSGSEQLIADVSRVLGLCSGRRTRSQILSAAPATAPDRDEALGQLTSAGFIVDARDRPRALLAELRRFAPGATDGEIAAIQRAPCWRDARAWSAGPDEARADARKPAERRSSLPLEDPHTRPVPLTLADLTGIAAAAYRTHGRWKPVASAGGLWPVVIHVLVPADDRCRGYWFDPDASVLRFVADCSQGIVADALLQRELAAVSADRKRSCFVISLDLHRIARKYKNRGALYALMEAGAVGHQLALSANRAGVGVRSICAFQTRALRQLVPDELDPLMIVVAERTDEPAGD